MLSIVLTVAGPIAVAAFVAAARRAGTTERARALGPGRRWRLPARMRPIVARALADADLALDPEPAVELWAGAVGAAGLVSAAMSPGLVLPALLVTSAAAPATLWVLRTRAHRRYAGALPLALEQIAAHLRGGGSVGVLVGTGAGRVCLVVGLLLEAVAALWMRRILASAEAR